MRLHLVTLLIILACLQVAAKSDAQRISLTVSDQTLEKTFNQIQEQSGYMFLYQKARLKNSVKVTLSLKEATLKEALDQLFKDQPFFYEIIDKTIVVKVKEDTILEQVQQYPKIITISGRVITAQGEPLPGVNIAVKGTKAGTVTDSEGVYSIRVEDNSILVFTYIGYQSQEVAINSREKINILLQPNQGELDQVEVIGYGVASKRFNTGNVSTVKGEDIRQQPVSNPLLALAGRVPGLFVSQGVGLPGAGINLKIQGQNSMTKGNDPFYVVDGVPFTSQLLFNMGASIIGASGGAGDGLAQGGSPFNLINPADIESITVLKDADATAIYGSRAANGAVLITTRKGKAGVTRGEITLQQGFSKAAKFLPLMNSQQYLAMRREAYTNDGLAVPNKSTKPIVTNYDLTLWDTTRYTDWQKALMGGTGHYSDVQASISGGSSQTNFKVNGGFHKETTVFPGDFSDVKGSFGMSIVHRSIDQKFSVQVTANYLSDNNRLPGADITKNAVQLAPIAPALYKADGTLNWQRIASGSDSVSTWLNPLAILNKEYQVISNNLIGNVLLSYRLVKGLELKTSLGYTNLSLKERLTTPFSSMSPDANIRAATPRTAIYGQQNTNSWIIEPQLTYSNRIGGGKLELLAGSTFQQNNMSDLLLNGSGYNSDLALKDVKSAASVTVQTTIDAVYKYAALFGRMTYNYRDKYILNLTGRRDGSSRFGVENQFHTFGALGMAWLFSNERMFRSLSPVLSFGKLRASYGFTGSDQIGDYQFMSLYGAPTGAIVFPYGGAVGLVPSRHYNPNIQWELTKKLQAGLELGFLKDRYLFTVNYYNNRSSNQLLSYPLPLITGFGTIPGNLPATVENSGWEFSLNTINIDSRKIRWTSSINFTKHRNRLIAFPSLSTSPFASSYAIGEPIGITKLFSVAGVNVKTGLYEYFTANGAISSSPSIATDRTLIYWPSPSFYGGIQNAISYGNVAIDFLFQFVKQQGNNYGIGSNPGSFYSDPVSSEGNQPVWVLDRWQKADDIARIQKFGTTQSGALTQLSNINYDDASYVRLKNVAVSWQMPDKWIQAVKLKNCRLFVNGQNLLTFTKYKGFDPESRSVGSLPPLRVITFGIQAGL